ncbi:unnamed protein product [Toxocara canis]|uniref:Aminotran_1_2 domain-containing protein n=1 Tax=Toxocara canis TaxID=6265 RepID=A0A183VEY9_TOXCA|nr:unnamed protein product [Toxocara canis]
MMPVVKGAALSISRSGFHHLLLPNHFFSKNRLLVANYKSILENSSALQVSALANLYSKLLNVEVNAQNDVLVTVGAYLALYYTFNGWINPGDEVIVLQPAYDCYVPQVEIAGGIAVPIPLELASNAKSSADYRVNLAAIEAKITDRTKFIVINNPHNPTGKLFSREELEGIADIVKRHNLLVIADEVYEWHVYQGREMIRFGFLFLLPSIPGMYERTITIGSAGKIFSVTGWKLGWAIGPAALLAPLKAVHQNCVFTCSTPTQEAVAQAIERELSVMWSQPMASYFKTELVSELQTKRDRMAAMLRAAGMKPIIPDSGYFMMADFSSLIRRDEFQSYGDSSDPLDFRFVRWMCREKPFGLMIMFHINRSSLILSQNLAMIPPSAFYSDEYKKDNDRMVRVCFFKVNFLLQCYISSLMLSQNLAMIPPSAFYSDEYKKDNDHMVRVCFFKVNFLLQCYMFLF